VTKYLRLRHTECCGKIVVRPSVLLRPITLQWLSKRVDSRFVGPISCSVLTPLRCIKTLRERSALAVSFRSKIYMGHVSRKLSYSCRLTRNCFSSQGRVGMQYSETFKVCWDLLTLCSTLQLSVPVKQFENGSMFGIMFSFLTHGVYCVPTTDLIAGVFFLVILPN